MKAAPWFIAKATFTPGLGEAWEKYIEWSGLTQLDEVVSLDPMLCPSVLPDIKPSYWPHIVNEDFLLDYFVDLEFLLEQVAGITDRNLLRVHLNPPAPVDAASKGSSSWATTSWTSRAAPARSPIAGASPRSSMDASCRRRASWRRTTEPSRSRRPCGSSIPRRSTPIATCGRSTGLSAARGRGLGAREGPGQEADAPPTPNSER